MSCFLIRNWIDVHNASVQVADDKRLRFAFQSDTSGSYPGVYIDDILVN